MTSTADDRPKTETTVPDLSVTEHTDQNKNMHSETGSSEIGSYEADKGKTTGNAEMTGSVETTGNAETTDTSDESAEIAVYVCGAVNKPDVYYLEEGDRICDAISAAGGFSYDADTEWLNQAETIADGEMIIVYTADETAQMLEEGIRRGTMAAVSQTAESAGRESSSADSGSQGASLVNLNTASREQLMTLPGIGGSKADAIIRYRTETGPFASVEDVMNISGIKNSTYEKIKAQITV